MIQRRLANWLARRLVSLAAPRDRDWARGMQAELAHILDDGDALTFAAGGLWAVMRRLTDSAGGLLKLGRFGIAAALMLFGVALVRLILMPDAVEAAWRTPELVVAGAALTSCFVGAGMFLCANRPARFAASLGIALAVNLAGAFILSHAGAQSPALTRWYAALLFEEFSLILGALAAGLFLLRAEALLSREGAS